MQRWAGGAHATDAARAEPDQPGAPPGPGEPIDTPTPPPTANYSGVYAVVAPLDLTQNGVLPGVLGPALGALIELHDHPGKALLDIVAVANIPTVSDAVKNLPSFLRDLLSNLLDKLIIDQLYANVPVVDADHRHHLGHHRARQDDRAAQHLDRAHASRGRHDDHRAAGHRRRLRRCSQQSTVVALDAKEKAAGAYPDDRHDQGARQRAGGRCRPHARRRQADAARSASCCCEAAGPLLFGQFGGATRSRRARCTNLVDCHGVRPSRSPTRSAATCRPRWSQTLCSTALDMLADQVTSRSPPSPSTTCSSSDGIGRSARRLAAQAADRLPVGSRRPGQVGLELHGGGRPASRYPRPSRAIASATLNEAE